MIISFILFNISSENLLQGGGGKGLQLRPNLIIYTFLYSFAQNKKRQTGFPA
jgi:hypothetical protein